MRSPLRPLHSGPFLRRCWIPEGEESFWEEEGTQPGPLPSRDCQLLGRWESALESSPCTAWATEPVIPGLSGASMAGLGGWGGVTSCHLP